MFASSGGISVSRQIHPMSDKLTGLEPRKLKLWEGKNKKWGMSHMGHQACACTMSYYFSLEPTVSMRLLFIHLRAELREQGISARRAHNHHRSHGCRKRTGAILNVVHSRPTPSDDASSALEQARKPRGTPGHRALQCRLQ